MSDIQILLIPMATRCTIKYTGLKLKKSHYTLMFGYIDVKVLREESNGISVS